MLAAVRSCFLLLVPALLAAVTLPMQAQILGPSASVTSPGFGGRAVNGVPATVTSFGRDGYGANWLNFGNCCANFFLPGESNLRRGTSDHRRHHRDRDAVVGVIEPAYIPYALGEEDEEEDAPDSRAEAPSDGQNLYGAAPRPHRDSTAKSSAASSESNDPPAPVAIQPSTVLVFRDGHTANVVNYAIVGDTLFDFEDDRTRKILLADLDLAATHKANDDRGVDFQIPGGDKGQ